MNPNSNLSVKIEFTLETSVLNFTDVLGGAGYIALGYNNADVKGIIKVSSSTNGVVYQNTGWDTDDYSAPDIIGSSSTWAKEITLPVDTDGNVVRDIYTIEYKVTGDGTGSTTDTFARYYNFDYTTPQLSLKLTKDDDQTYFTVYDTTVYEITSGGATISPDPPITSVRSLRVVWPDDSGVADSLTSNDNIKIGPPLSVGSYSISLSGTLTYFLYSNSDNGKLDVYVIDTVTKINTTTSYNTGCYNRSILTCYEGMVDKYNAAKQYNIPKAKQMWLDIQEISTYYQMYLMAQSIKSDTTDIISNLSDIFTKHGYTLEKTTQIGISYCVGGELQNDCLTTEEKLKLAGIEEGAEKNVQPDFNQSDTLSDEYIKHKPSDFTVEKEIPASTNVLITHNREKFCFMAVYVDDNGLVQELFVADNASDLKSVNVYSDTAISLRDITLIFKI